MYNLVSKYVDIIYVQTDVLLNGKTATLSLAQRQALELIKRYSSQLHQTNNQFMQSLPSLDEEMHRHELINILTPIVGYIEMLLDGWIGQIQDEHLEPLELIRENINLLYNYISSYSFRTQIADSA